MNLKKRLTLVIVTFFTLVMVNTSYADGPPEPTGNGGVVCNPGCTVFETVGGGGGGGGCITIACNQHGCIFLMQTFDSC